MWIRTANTNNVDVIGGWPSAVALCTYYVCHIAQYIIQHGGRIGKGLERPINRCPIKHTKTMANAQNGL